MGHLTGKDLYKKLGRKLDGMAVRVPWNDALYHLIKELYSEDEAALVVKMPYGPSKLGRIARSAGMDEDRVRKILDGLCEKGLVVDLWAKDSYRYMISPMVVGIFEYTMMRTGGGIDFKKTAELFTEYMFGDDSFFRENFKEGRSISPLRALPYEESVLAEEHVEILDYEKAEYILSNAKTYSIGLCSCRHEKTHLGEKKCATPLETCSSFDRPAEYLVSHNLARKSSKQEMLDNLARSKELGLVISADNTKRNVGFLCHCCGCCCNLLLGYSRFGYAGTIVTSNFIAGVNKDSCTGCAKCGKACPVGTIAMKDRNDPSVKYKKIAVVDESVCIGCGVCSLACANKSIMLHKRKERVFHPASTFERVILQSLERNTLPNLIFDDPERLSHAFMRGFLGGFFRLPGVKRALAGDLLKSRFLKALK